MFMGVSLRSALYGGQGGGVLDKIEGGYNVILALQKLVIYLRK